MKPAPSKILQALATLLDAATLAAPPDDPDKYDHWRALVVAARAEWNDMTRSPGAAPTARGAAPNVCRFCGFMWGTYNPDDPCPGPICAERRAAARGDETAPAGPVVVSGQMNDTPETRELVAAAAGMLASSPPPSGGARASFRALGPFPSSVLVCEEAPTPAPALSETRSVLAEARAHRDAYRFTVEDPAAYEFTRKPPASPSPPGFASDGSCLSCGKGYIRGDGRIVGCTDRCRAPAAPSGAGDAGATDGSNEEG
jgi:hypothetical protein